MTDVNGSDREPAATPSSPSTPFDTSADTLRADAMVGDVEAPQPDTSANPEARAFAGGAPKGSTAGAKPLKDAAQDLRENGEALFAAGLEAGRARAEDARRWAELKRLEAAERVRNEPMKAVGVAFGVGLVAGLLLRRR